MSVRIDRRRLSVAQAYAELEDAMSGGVVLFLGRVRPDPSGRGRVRALTYETHHDLALKTFRDLEAIARARFGARRVVIWHRVDEVAVGSPSVIVGVSAPHRAAAFAAARYLIDRLKKTAPIWKREVTGGRRAHNPRRTR
jgi:molybdopterin synthase catalytic subunit